MRLKCLWQLINVTGLWSRIIVHKYFGNRSLEDWICARNFKVIGTSYFWNGFIRILVWITSQLGWRVGNDLKIRLGVDPIAGHNSLYLLSAELRDYLIDLGISTLAQAQNLDGSGPVGTNWYTASDLYLGGEWDEQWSTFAGKVGIVSIGVVCARRLLNLLNIFLLVVYLLRS